MPNPIAEEGCDSSDLYLLHPPTSARMTAVETCALPGCSKPPFPSPGHLTCGILHHQLLMAGRFDQALPHPHQQILDRNGAGLCALLSCPVPPQTGHSWCTRSHHLLWLSKFTSSLLPEQICKLPGCVRHVFVDDNSSPSQFCGWRHCQKFVMRSVLQCKQQQLRQQESLPSPPSTVESSYVQVPSIESLVLSLRDYAFHEKSPKNVRIDHEDFFNKHPWDVCTEGLTCWLIVRSKYSSKGKRVMVTKDDYHWKQQGRPVIKNINYVHKYFTYRKLKGKQDEAADLDEECTYFMDEYTMEGVKEFSLIKLRKSTGSHSKHLKGRPIRSNKRFRAQVTDTCSQNTISTKDDVMAVDSCFWNLSPLDDDCPYDLDHFLG